MQNLYVYYTPLRNMCSDRSRGWQHYAGADDAGGVGAGGDAWVGAQRAGALLAVRLTHAATAVRITVLTSAGAGGRRCACYARTWPRNESTWLWTELWT
jgi:hypothetical protein